MKPLTLLILVACQGADPEEPFAGAVIALQGQSAVAFVDEAGEQVETLDLHQMADGLDVPWMIHNVQVTPDGQTALVTAMPPMDDPTYSTSLPDQLVVLDLPSRQMVQRCVLDYGLGVAHVVTDGITAWATAYSQDRVIAVDLASCETTARWPLPAGTSPHGLRRAGNVFYVAGMGDGSLHRVSLTGEVQSWDLPGLAVQVAVVPDGSAVLVTLLDTRQIARLDLISEDVALIDLPEGSTGPAQIYPSPDSASVWVADQGSLDGLLPGHELFQLDAATGALLARVSVHEAPHGVVVSPDGRTVWVTTLSMGTVDRVDADTLELLSSVSVGSDPNGISLGWAGGAMP